MLDFYEFFMLILGLLNVHPPTKESELHNFAFGAAQAPLYQFHAEDCSAFYDYYATSEFNYAKLLNEL